jgi:putative alpha-1,2-mannosidase
MHYRNNFDGLDGNEDCGQMSAWFVMSAMGLYAVDPVSATYVLSAPLFKRISIPLGNGRQLVIEAEGGDDPQKSRYIQSVSLNGKALDRLWVRHEDLMQGAHLVFKLGEEPNTALGTSEDKMPPSLTS